MTMMFINLPVTDLERAKAFYTATGLTFNPLLSDHNAACVIVEADHSALMLVTREYFQTFSTRPVGNPADSVSAATAIFLDSREAVDVAAAAGIAAGGTEDQPAADYGFMYQRQLTDPDGNILEFGWADPTAGQASEVLADQQA